MSLPGTADQTAVATAGAGDATDSPSVAAALARLWRSALGPKAARQAHVLQMSVGMGRVLRFIDDTEAELGVRVPISAVLRLGTVAALADAIESGRDWPPHLPLILLRAGSRDQCLCIVSTGIGLILDLCELAQLIDFPGQIWGLQPPGIDGEAAPLNRIEDFAQHYAQAIRQQAPDATIHVLGYSFSGLIAFELARSLSVQHARLGMVGILDTACCDKFWPRTVWFAMAAHRMKIRLAEAWVMPPRQLLGRLYGLGLALLRHLRRRLDPPTVDGGSGQSMYYVGGLDGALQRVRDAGIVAYERYRPTWLDRRIVLFRSALGDPYACDPVAIWQRLVPRLDIVHVPGSHATMVRKPLVQTLAREISRQLAREPDIG